jgi:hypothetical protein
MAAPAAIDGVWTANASYYGWSALRASRDRYALAFALSYVATPVPHFVAFEVRAIDTLCLFRFLTGLRHGALVAVGWVEMVIYVAPEIGRAMKPWARANEDAANKPFGTVVAGGGTGVWGDVIVTIRTVGGYSDFDVDLSLCFRDGNR